MGFHDPSGQVDAESQATRSLRRYAPNLVEPLEQVRDPIGRSAGPRIALKGISQAILLDKPGKPHPFAISGAPLASTC